MEQNFILVSHVDFEKLMGKIEKIESAVCANGTHNAGPPKNALYREKVAAKILGISKRSLVLLRQSGKIVFTANQNGRLITYTQQALDDYIIENSIKLKNI